MSAPEMSDRLSGRVESTEALSLGRLVVGAACAHDSQQKKGGSTKRLGAAKLQVIKQSLTDRDLRLIELLATVKLASGRQLRHLLWGDTPSDARGARRELKKLTELRVVARLGRSIGGVRRREQRLAVRARCRRTERRRKSGSKSATPYAGYGLRGSCRGRQPVLPRTPGPRIGRSDRAGGLQVRTRVLANVREAWRGARATET